MGRVRALNVRESAFGRKLGGTAENFVPCICVHERTAYAGVFIFPRRQRQMEILTP